MATVCPSCGREFSGIGQHLSFSDCPYPNISDEQNKIIDGVLMGDGSLSTQNNNPYFRVVNTSKQYLEFLDGKLGVLTTGVKLLRTAEESANRDNKSGFNTGACKSDYSDVYYLQSLSHPDYTRYKDWYNSDGKSFSGKVDINPISVSHWYVCDGHIRTDRGNQIKVSAVNEMDNIENLRKSIEESGCPSFDRVENSDAAHLSLVWNKDSARDLLEYMCGPISGYEHKYPKS
jgi:hypothetical protein